MIGLLVFLAEAIVDSGGVDGSTAPGPGVLLPGQGAFTDNPNPIFNQNPFPNVPQSTLKVITTPGQQVIIPQATPQQTGLQVAQANNLVQPIYNYVQATPGSAAVFTETPGHQVSLINYQGRSIVRPGLP